MSQPTSPKSVVSRTSRSSSGSRARLAIFVFPGAAGHVNPSLPICRRLVDLGWQVEYVCNAAFEAVIEDTGAQFRDVNEVCQKGGIADVREMILQSIGEYQDPGAQMWAMNFGSIHTEKLVPIFTEFFKEMAPRLVIYCPVLCPYAHLASLHLKLRCVALLTAAGPGYLEAAFAQHGGSALQLAETVKKNEANQVAVAKIRKILDRPHMSLNTSVPLVQDYYAKLNLVTTLPSLADPLNEIDAGVYFGQGKKFEFVGPLLDCSPSDRGRGGSESTELAELFQEIEDAKSAGREIVYVSMGTVLTGDHEAYGWHGTGGTALTGKQMCRAVYAAVFQELGGGAEAGHVPLVVLAVGPQADALSDIQPPANCRCFSVLPQVDVLQRSRENLAFCVTHGRQNSFMECLSVAAPLVVCPGFGDQLSNAQRAAKLQLGLAVERPKTGDPSEALETYQSAVSNALKTMLGTSRETFKATARTLAEELQYAGGIDRAVDLILNA